MLAGGLPPELAGLITEMGEGVRKGIITKDFFENGGDVVGKIKLADFVNEFKERYERE